MKKEGTYSSGMRDSPNSRQTIDEVGTCDIPWLEDLLIPGDEIDIYGDGFGVRLALIGCASRMEFQRLEFGSERI